jgi:putative phage-type endonuclease
LSKLLTKSVENRTRGIGGSDVASIFGLNKWKPLPLLWLEKTGKLPKAESASADPEWMEWGNYLEEPIAKVYAKRTGRKLRRPGHTIAHPEFSFMMGNPDRFQKDKQRAGDPRGVLEIKCAMFGKLREWSAGGVPAPYYLQLQHYLAITELAWGSFAVLFGGNRLVEFDVPRDEKLIELMIEKEREFWSYVTRNQAPPMELGAEWNQQLVNFFPKPTERETLQLSAPEDFGRAFRLLRLKEQVKLREKEINEHESYFKVKLANHAQARIGSSVKVAWTPGERKSVDLDALRERYPQIAAELTRAKPQRRFSITALEDLPADQQEEEEAEAPLIISARRIELD